MEDLLFKKLSVISIFIVFVVSINLLFAKENQSLESIGKNYLKFYSSYNIKELDKLYADDAEFTDPISVVYQPNSPITVKGKMNILEFLKSASQMFKSFKYDIQEHFISGDYAVYMGHTIFEMYGKDLGIKEESVRFKTKIVTILKIVNGKIQTHTDYADYTTFLKQIADYSK